MASGGTKTEARRLGSMASGSIEPRQKGPLWLRFLTEVKNYALLASPQYASVPESVQNIKKNNRCQSPFLHWCLIHLVNFIALRNSIWKFDGVISYDNGYEFEMKNYFNIDGITIQTCIKTQHQHDQTIYIETPVQNDIVERKHQHILNNVTCI